MTKIKLVDGTILNVESVTNDCIAIIMADLVAIATYADAFTKENLATAEVIDKNDEVVSTLKDKYVTNFDGTQIIGEENYIVCFRIADIYTLEEQIAMLEAENAALKESQEIQDEAIVELAGIIAE